MKYNVHLLLLFYKLTNLSCFETIIRDLIVSDGSVCDSVRSLRGSWYIIYNNALSAPPSMLLTNERRKKFPRICGGDYDSSHYIDLKFVLDEYLFLFKYDYYCISRTPTDGIFSYFLYAHTSCINRYNITGS